MVTARHILFDARVRSEWWTRIVAARTIHQDTTFTLPDRYPLLFGEAQALLGQHGAHRMLSLGCSSGEEVVALRRYFPKAFVVGAEINRTQLAACRRLPADPLVAFIESTPAAIATHAPYDAVFCMAVLQRRPHSIDAQAITDLSRIYPFARFDAQVRFLVAQLRAGGLLVVHHCQYRIEDSTSATELEAVPGAGVALSKGGHFAPDGSKIEPPPVVARVFRKIEAQSIR